MIAGMSSLKKISLTIAGHSTSISLEEPFWTEVRRLAAQQGMSVAALVRKLDETRPGNLSSALRVYVLEQVKAGL
jgi:predicted DNA-binding ribbon-helix-helix protein